MEESDKILKEWMFNYILGKVYRKDMGMQMIDEQEETIELRRRLDYMPFDLYGMHSTGYEVCLGDPVKLADWWYEYEDENGDIHYFR